VHPYSSAFAQGASQLLQALVPDMVVNPALLDHGEATTPARANRAVWVATAGAQVVGWAEKELDPWTTNLGRAWIWAAVHPHFRGRGLGRRLYDLAEASALDHDPEHLKSFARQDEEIAQRLLIERGFSETRRDLVWELDPTTVDLGGYQLLRERRREQGYELVELSKVEDQVLSLYEMYAAAARDIPSDDPVDNISYDDWICSQWNDPGLDRVASAVVLFEEKPVSFAFIRSDHGSKRATHELTGTVPEHRHKGLAGLAKLATISWAAENGFILFTENDSTNQDMLSINRRLGYQPRPGFITFSKELKR